MIEDQCRAAAKAAKVQMERTTAEGELFAMMIVAERANEGIVAVVSPYDHDRNHMVRLASVMAKGYGPDALTVVFDSYRAHSEDNPVTGKPWGPGEMQDVADNHDGRQQGWVTDCLIVNTLNRAGDVCGLMAEYHADGQQITWGSEKSMLDNGNPSVRLQGALLDHLRAAMAEPDALTTMSDKAAEVINDLDPGLTTREFGDYLTTVALSNGMGGLPSCHVAAMTAPGSTLARLLLALPNVTEVKDL